RVAARRPDVIVLDLLMPELNGFEFLAALRRDPAWRGIPVVVLTSMDLTAEDRQVLNGSVERIIQKGAWERDQILGEIGRVLAPVGGARARGAGGPRGRRSSTWRTTTTTSSCFGAAGPAPGSTWSWPRTASRASPWRRPRRPP